MKTKKKVLVCGTRFGQFYLEALSQLRDDVEIAGVLASGSKRSIACAQYYGIPLYTRIKDIPLPIDLACVVIKSEVLGGKGTEIALSFMNQGIHVLMEQPLHHKELAECLQGAKQNGVLFALGNLYANLPAVHNFINNVHKIGSKQKILYVNIDFATQVAYPLIQILGEVLPALRPWQNIGVINHITPFQTLVARIKDVEVTFRAHNEVDKNDGDGDMHLLHQMTIGFPAGRLMLVDTHGPVLWLPRIHFPQSNLIPANLGHTAGASEANMLEKNAVKLYDHDASHREIFTKSWIEAIQEDIQKMLPRIGKNNPDWKEQQFPRKLLYCQQWHELMSGLGYPHIAEKSEYQYYSSDLLEVARQEESSNPECEIPMGIRKLNEACWASMLYILQQPLDKANIGLGYWPDTLVNGLAIKQAYQPIIYRWIAILHQAGYLLKNAEKYYFATFMEHNDVEQAWRRAKQAWTKSVGDALVFEYFHNNATRLREIMTGQLKATYLLFPEGKFDVADALYANTAIAQCLNKEIAEFIRDQIIHKKTNILELGAGTGATTRAVIEKIKDLNIDKKYIYSDVSGFFMAKAKNDFSGLDWLDFQKINIDQKLSDIFKEHNKMDIVIAVGVINNARDIQITLQSIYDILQTNGYLLLVEAIGESVPMLISQAFMMNEAQDIRQNKNITFLDLDNWVDLLSRCGFSLKYWIPPSTSHLSVYNQKLFVLQKTVTDESKYRNETKKTETCFSRFLLPGEHLDSTGDDGEYLADGEMESPAKDTPVKRLNDRLELEEIENALKKNDKIREAKAVIIPDGEGGKTIIAAVIAAKKEAAETGNWADAMIGQKDRAGIMAENIQSAFQIRDDIALASMIRIFKHADVFVEKKAYTLEDILQSTQIREEYRWIIRYWLQTLLARSVIRQVSGTAYIYQDKYADYVLENAFTPLKALWSQGIGTIPFIDYYEACIRHLQEVMEGKVNPVELLYPEGSTKVIDSLYRDSSIAVYFNTVIAELVSQIAQSQQQTVKILEVGAGSGATAIRVMKKLKADKINHFEYYFTDIAQSFFCAARSNFAEDNNIHYKILNIDGDYRKQGFYPNYFDIIIAAGVLENAQNIRDTLQRFNEIIKPEGTLFLTAPIVDEPWILVSQVFMMTKPQDEIRKESIYLGEEKWQNLLQEENGQYIRTVSGDKNYNMRLFIKKFFKGKEWLSEREINEHIKKWFPDHRIPYQIQLVDEFPLDRNGIIDISRIQQWFIPKNGQESAEKLYNQDEKMLAEIKQIFINFLGLTEVRSEDNFYESGADFFIMAQIAVKLKELLQKEANLKEITFDQLLQQLLNYPTLESLWKLIEANREGRDR